MLDSLLLTTILTCHDEIQHARDEHWIARLIAGTKAGHSEKEVKECEKWYERNGSKSNGVCGHAQTPKEHAEAEKEVEDALTKLGMDH